MAAPVSGALAAVVEPAPTPTAPEPEPTEVVPTDAPTAPEPEPTEAVPTDVPTQPAASETVLYTFEQTVTESGVKPTLPATVALNDESGNTVDLPIEWEDLDPSVYSAREGGEFVWKGTVAGYEGYVEIPVFVNAATKLTSLGTNWRWRDVVQGELPDLDIMEMLRWSNGDVEYSQVEWKYVYEVESFYPGDPEDEQSVLDFDDVDFAALKPGTYVVLGYPAWDYVRVGLTIHPDPNAAVDDPATAEPGPVASADPSTRPDSTDADDGRDAQEVAGPQLPETGVSAGKLLGGAGALIVVGGLLVLFLKRRD